MSKFRHMDCCSVVDSKALICQNAKIFKLAEPSQT